MTKKEQLIEAVQEALQTNKFLFAIHVAMEGFPDDEVIVNTYDNFEKKLAYWCNVYDDDLVHKHSKGIAIVHWKVGQFYDDLF